MIEEIELATLSMADSDLVLTSRHVYQRTHRGWLGQTTVVIPRSAVTTVKLEWRRSLGLLTVGLIALVIAAPLQWFELPFSVPFYVAPAFAVLGFALMLLSIVKSKMVQIIAPSATIGGAPRNYADAQRFCSLVLSDAVENSPSGVSHDKGTENKRKPMDSQWQL